VLLATDRDGSDVEQTAGGVDGELQGLPPLLRIDLGTGGMAGGSGADETTALRITYDNLAALR
jgi:hypothetical protein